MKKLDFIMPNYSRIIFPNKELKDKWSKKIDLARNLYNKLEILSVTYNIRKIATIKVLPENLFERTEELASLGLSFMPIKKVGVNRGFAHYHTEYIPGKSFAIFGVVYKNIDDANGFKHYYDIKDHNKIGELLGFPKCCREFFISAYEEDPIVDPVYEQALNTDKKYIKYQQENLVRLKNELDFKMNTLLKPLGVRLFPHIPCSLTCKDTLDFSNNMFELANFLELDGIEELKELLTMPVEWDCLKGIAFISTPMFKYEYNSITCYPKHVVQREGTYFPEEAPRGLKFPWTERWTINGDLIQRNSLKVKKELDRLEKYQNLNKKQ